MYMISEWPHIHQKRCNNIRFEYMRSRTAAYTQISAKGVNPEQPLLSPLPTGTKSRACHKLTKSVHAKCDHELKQTSFAKSCARQIPVSSFLAVLTEVRDMSPNSFECRACCRRLCQQGATKKQKFVHAMVANRNFSL